jgi:hypothetical protein
MGWEKGRKRGPRKPKVEIMTEQAEVSLGQAEQGQTADASVAADATPVPLAGGATGLSDPPSHYRKAIDWQLDSPDLPWQIVRCRECNDDMYTRNPAKAHGRQTSGDGETSVPAA